MSSFQVIPAAVSDAGSRLSAISPDIQEHISRVSEHSGAAAGTRADGALSDLVGRWAAVLPHFALSGETLSTAVGKAAVAYTNADADVAKASEISGGSAPQR